jgi:hypothetical protein
MAECPENQRLVCAAGQKHPSYIVSTDCAGKVARVSSVVETLAFLSNGGSAIEIAHRSSDQSVHFLSLFIWQDREQPLHSPDLGNQHRAVTDWLNGA